MKKTIEASQIAKEHGMTVLVFEDDFDSIDTIDVNNTSQFYFLHLSVTVTARSLQSSQISLHTLYWKKNGKERGNFEFL